MNTTATMSSHAFLPKKPITCPAALKMKLAIAPIIPGRIAAILCPSAFKPFPTPRATVPNPFARLDTMTPMTTPTEVTTAKAVKPCFLKMSLILSRKVILSSACSITRSCSSILLFTASSRRLYSSITL